MEIIRDHESSGLIIVDRNRDAAERVDVFAPLFGLTPAETRVLAALISGKGLVSAVKRLEMTEQTARTHLKHILSKTDTHRQAELMRLFYEVTISLRRMETATVHGISGALSGCQIEHVTRVPDSLNRHARAATMQTEARSYPPAG